MIGPEHRIFTAKTYHPKRVLISLLGAGNGFWEPNPRSLFFTLRNHQHLQSSNVVHSKRSEAAMYSKNFETSGWMPSLALQLIGE